VRISLAEMICKISSNFEKKSIISGIVPLLETLLKDESLDVRLTLMNNINLMNTILGPELIKKHILPLFNNIKNEK
jgi:hypothetical protein